MKFSLRELVLAWATTVVVLLGLTYWLGQPKAKEWRDAVKAREQLTWRIKEIDHLMSDQDSVSARIAEIRKQLPQHPAGKDVTAELMMTLEKTAQEHGLSLLRREPEEEKSVGDLFEVAINCTWEGELDAVVHFLYALQVQGAILDVRQMTITPGQGGPDRLKGNFTVDCAYTRATSGLDTVRTEPAAAGKPAPPK